MKGELLNSISVLFVPVFVTVIILYGLYKKAPVYDYFIEGAREGLKTCIEMLPFIIAIFIAIEAVTSSGAMEVLQNLLSPLFTFFGIPEDLIPLILLRPVSGSGSLVIAEQIMRESGPDSFAGLSAAIMSGTCETVFYVLALYYGVTSVKKLRHALPAGIAGYIAGVFASVYLSYMMLIS
ncbi:MAG: spore maturation protein [Firmicutes bacterium]|nr:spore maturation protein [Bacillota bacterium]